MIAKILLFRIQERFDRAIPKVQDRRMGCEYCNAREQNKIRILFVGILGEIHIEE